MKLEIPNYATYNIRHMVFDYNGTLAEGGKIDPETLERLESLAEECTIHVVTADTYGTVSGIFKESPVVVEIISRENGAEDKRRVVDELGAEETIAVGNGYIDRFMLKKAALGFCILGPEGASTQALLMSDVVLRNIDEFFKLMEDGRRLYATLRG